MADNFNMQVVGLKGTIKALGRVDDDLRKDTTQIIKKHVVKLKTETQNRYKGSPGVSRAGYPFGKGAVVHRAASTGAFIGINKGGARKNAAVFAAEFGAKQAMVPQYEGPGEGYSIPRGQNEMRRRTFPVWRGNSTTIRGKSGPGWVLMPLLRKRVPQLQDDLTKDLVARFDQTMRKAGVPRG